MAKKTNERRGLGRGLSALMADIGVDDGFQSQEQVSGSARPNLTELSIEQIVPNPDQPRQTFEASALEDLANSIKDRGIVQPIIVRQSPTDTNKVEIVAGERRWRAAQLAQLQSIPVILKEFTDQEVLEVAIVENIQREGLNAIEEAAGYKQLIDRFGHTQEKVAEALGKSRSHITNLLRLLNLPDGVQKLVVDGDLSAGHARALVTVDDCERLARKVVAEGLSVRQTEKLARENNTSSPPRGRASSNGQREKDADTRVLEEDLSANLGMGVVIDHRAGGEGRLTIQYKTLDQLDQLCQLLSSVR